jgi:hypothetical protein
MKLPEDYDYVQNLRQSIALFKQPVSCARSWWQSCSIEWIAGRSSDKICMMTTRLACNWTIESSYWRMDNNSDVGLLTGYVLYWLPIELGSMDLDTFSHWFGLHPSLHTSW